MRAKPSAGEFDRPVKFCPFCASDDLKLVRGVPRCMACRTAFMVSYSRNVRAAPGAGRSRRVARRG